MDLCFMHGVRDVVVLRLLLLGSASPELDPRQSSQRDVNLLLLVLLLSVFVIYGCELREVVRPLQGEKADQGLPECGRRLHTTKFWRNASVNPLRPWYARPLISLNT